MNFNSLGETLPVMFYGLVGIFMVIGMIALSITLLGKAFKKKESES